MQRLDITPNIKKALYLAKRQLEFNKLMLAFYPSNDDQPMMNFLISCIPDSAIEFMNN